MEYLLITDYFRPRPNAELFIRRTGLMSKVQDKFDASASVKVFRYSFPEAIPIFFNRLKVILSLSNRYKMFTSDWL